MYLHKKSYETRYTDVDFLDNLKLSALLSMLEESACLSADELGFGYEDITPKSLGFILANWYVELKRPIRLGEVVTVNTWPIKPKKMIVFRDFEFFIGEEKVGVATSRWCVVDLQTFAIKPALLAFPEEPIEYNDFRSVDFADWKISDLENKKVAYQKVVTYSDYDHYNHVNNTKYADFILDVFNVEELKNKSILSVQITYSKQCKIGEVLTFSVGNDNEFYYIDGRVDGELRVSAKIKFSRLNG